MIQADDGQYQADIQHRDLEELLLEISYLFINLPTEEIDVVIEETQGRICEHLSIDLSALWQWSDKDNRLMTIIHLYTIEGGPDRPVDIDGSKTFPWVYQKMLEGETLAFSNSQLPREADIDKESRKSFGVESSVVLPLKTGNGPLLGILTFDILHRERSWSEQEIKRLKLVAQVFYNAFSLPCPSE